MATFGNTPELRESKNINSDLLTELTFSTVQSTENSYQTFCLVLRCFGAIFLHKNKLINDQYCDY